MARRSVKQWYNIFSGYIAVVWGVWFLINGHYYPAIAQSIALAYLLFVTVVLILERPRKKHRPRRRIYKGVNHRYGDFVYLLRRRKDGIYKLGKTNNLNRRLTALNREYGKFDVVNYWLVDDRHSKERTALDMTKDYHHKERGHKELRQMTHVQLRDFIARFSREV